MQKAIDEAKQGITQGQTPFGACIVKNNQIISCDHNVVWRNNDITAHAEIHAIRNACQTLKTIDLSKCILYSTCEPCPMCFAACHWAKISTIIYGTSIEDAKNAGFNELSISNQKMKKEGNSPIEIIPDFMKEENLELFNLWLKNNPKSY